MCRYMRFIRYREAENIIWVLLILFPANIIWPLSRGYCLLIWLHQLSFGHMTFVITHLGILPRHKYVIIFVRKIESPANKNYK